MKRFVARYLDPASRLGEILFGLIMTLTVTLSVASTSSTQRIAKKTSSIPGPS
jgi:hypothetical protein